MLSPRSRRLLLSAFLVLGLALRASPAAADEAALQRAREAYKAASQAVLAGDLEKGLALFEEAALASPHAATHLAAGRTAFTLRDKPRAADHLVRALQLGLEGADADEAKKTLEQISPELGSVRVTGLGGTARVDAGVVFSTPAILHAKPGPHALRVTRGERQVTLPVEVRAGEQGVFAVDHVLAENPKPGPEPTPPPEPAAEPTAFPNGLTWAGVATLVLGGVAGGAAAGVGAAALSAKDDFLASRTREDYDAATALETGTNVAIGGAIALAAVGTGLIVGSLFLESKSSGAPPTARRPRLKPDGLVIRF